MGFYVILGCTKEYQNKILQDKIAEKEINLNISRSSINFIATEIAFLINLTNRKNSLWSRRAFGNVFRLIAFSA